LSVADSVFPPRAPHSKRRILRSNLHHEPVLFPPTETPDAEAQELVDSAPQASAQYDARTTMEPALSASAETSATILSDAEPENMSTQPTTPSSAVASATKSQQNSTQRRSSRATAPILPVIPAIPTSPVTARRSHRDSVASAKSKPELEAATKSDEEEPQTATEAAPVAPVPPKSWADLVRKQSAANGAVAATTAPIPIVNGLSLPKSESLGDVLGEMNVDEAPSKVVFLQPRGLANTGNMCYMNSVRIVSSVTRSFTDNSAGTPGACFLHSFLRLFG